MKIKIEKNRNEKKTKKMSRPCYRMAEPKNSKIYLRRNYITKLKLIGDDILNIFSCRVFL